MADDKNEFLDLQKEFLEEVTTLLEQCEESYLKLEDAKLRVEELDKIFRLAHSLKGAGAAVGFTDLADFAHEVEECLSILRKKPDLINSEVVSILLKSGDAFKSRIHMLKAGDNSPWLIDELKTEVKNFAAKLSFDSEQETVQDTVPEKSPETENNIQSGSEVKPEKTKSAATSFIKVDSTKVEYIQNLVGELVVIKSQLLNEIPLHGPQRKLGSILSLMENTIRDLQDRTLSLRMTPLKGLFLKTQRMVRDLSIKLEKPVDLELSGESTEIDRTTAELISESFLHMVRNALDHGIESPSQRVLAGKSERGKLILTASKSGGNIILKLQDDGAGIQREKVIKKAIERKLLSATYNTSSLSDTEVYSFLFSPGFSTAEQVTDISGRGVGLDVVKHNIEKLKGNVEISSVWGQGTTFTVSLPMMTSIIEGMIISLFDHMFVLPLENIVELVTITEKDLVSLQNGEIVLRHRDHIYPVFDIEKWLMPRGSNLFSWRKECLIALVDNGIRIIGIPIQKIHGQNQVVLKPLGKYFQNVKGISGATVLGDGRIALVLDPHSIAELTDEKRLAA